MALTLKVDNGEFIFSGRSMQITKDKNALLKDYNKQIYNYGIVLCMLPSGEEIIKINQQIGNARVVRNDYLSKRIELYEKSKSTLSVSEYKKNILPKLKEEKEFLKLSDKFALESAIEHVDIAYKNFFENLKKGRKAGFPKFVSKYKPSGNKYTTKYTNGNIKLIMEDNLPYIQLPKVGKIRIVIPKGKTFNDLVPTGTKITSASIQRQGNNYTVSIQLETVIDEIIPINSVYRNNIYAMDMGIKSFGVYGNEDITINKENPRWIKIHQKRLRRFQKSLSRKQYDFRTHTGSKNYYKAKIKLAKEHRKLRNQRKDFQHKLSREIVNNCNVFICEDLNIKGMVKNHKLAKEISSCGWAQFLEFVKYKLQRNGGIFIKVDRFFASSKLCYHCNYKNDNLTLKDREWTCPVCGNHLDRDENAKNNLIKEGIRILENELNVAII